MKHKYGYLLLESVVSLSSMVIIILVLYSIFLSTINLKLKVEDKIELQQQSLEIIQMVILLHGGKLTLEKQKI
mgnify:CR=1 FL=1